MIKTPKTCTIIDPGIIGSRISAPSWIEYSLVPAIREKFGADSIDNLILMAPGIVLFDAITELLRIIPVHNIYVPIWHGQTPPPLLKAYKKMQEAALKQGATVHRFNKKPLMLSLDKKSELSITPLEAECIYRTTTYRATKITAQLPEDTITLYSIKYKT